MVDDLRRITREYAKKIGGLQTIPELPRRRAPIREPTYPEDLILVGNLEELVNLSLQEIVQPLDELGLDSRFSHLFSHLCSHHFNLHCNLLT